MYNGEMRRQLQIGVLRDLYKRELITKKQLDKCIERIIRESEPNESKTSSGLLQG